MRARGGVVGSVPQILLQVACAQEWILLDILIESLRTVPASRKEQALAWQWCVRVLVCTPPLCGVPCRKAQLMKWEGERTRKAETILRAVDCMERALSLLTGVSPFSLPHCEQGITSTITGRFVYDVDFFGRGGVAGDTRIGMCPRGNKQGLPVGMVTRARLPWSTGYNEMAAPLAPLVG